MSAGEEERTPAVAIGPARATDVAAIRALYNHEIRTGVALWNTVERTDDEMTGWFEERRNGGFPVLVARDVDTDRFLGYGTFGSFRPHDGYRATVEHSLYVAVDARGRGVGGLLLRALEQEARAQGRRVMIGGVDARNVASIALHQRAGFEERARLPDVGWKFDRWLTLVLLHKLLE